MKITLPDPLPRGYEGVAVDGALAVTLPGARRWVEGALSNGWTLHGAAAEHPEARELHGRGTVYVIPAGARRGAGAPPGAGSGAPGPSSSAPESTHWAVRHYHRGGWMSPLLRDRYWKTGEPRPFQELRVSEKVRATEVPTPRVVAAAVYPSRVFYRADLVTEFVPHSRDLASVLFDRDKVGLGGSADRRDALEAAAELVREMARSGVHHPDLNAGNVLLRWSGAAPDPYLLDLDRAHLGEAGKPLARTLHARLERSLRKLEKKSGRNLSDQEYRVLEEGALREW